MNGQKKIITGWIIVGVLVAIFVVMSIKPPMVPDGKTVDDLRQSTNPVAKPAVALAQPDKQLLDELEKQSEEAHRKFHELEQQSAGQTTGDNTNHHVFDQVNQAFVELGHKAGSGDEQAYATLVTASGMQYLQGSATEGLGVAAGDGCDRAVDILVEPKQNGLLQSGAVGALRFPAEKGNAKAIKFLSEVTKDPKSTALWFLAADGLGKAAAAGNEDAIGALINLLGTDDPSIRRAVRDGLTQAAVNGNQHAQEAVKKMGW